tara:strand:+ start:43 stop:330 length:288 start_codon:yes stop_codon:yes gene_type:complete
VSFFSNFFKTSQISNKLALRISAYQFGSICDTASRNQTNTVTEGWAFNSSSYMSQKHTDYYPTCAYRWPKLYENEYSDDQAKNDADHDKLSCAKI